MKNNLHIERVKNPAELAGKHLSDILALNTGKPILLLIAGGSAMNVLEYIKPDYLSPDITVTMTDDRFSEDLDVNNFAILQSTSFYNNLIEADAFCINTQPNEGETLEEFRARFDKNLKEWKQDFPKGVIVALYGMGSDGHTGGMIPGVYDEDEFNKEFNTEDRLVGIFDAIKAGKEEINPYPQRISTTIPFMKNWVDHAVFYLTGDDKKTALDKAEEGTEPYFKRPSTIIAHMKDVVVCTDIGA